MGQVQSGNRSKKLSKKGRRTYRGDFGKFPELPYELRSLIWEFVRLPRVVEVIRTRYSCSARWVSRCPVPVLLRINQETRALALKHYRFHESEKVKIFLDPAIDTLFFGSDMPPDLARFLLDAGDDDLKSLRHLAIHEFPFSIWNSNQFSKLFSRLSFLMMDLERLMIGTVVAAYAHSLPRQTHWDSWGGWLFGGGLVTAAESLNLSGTTREHIFSTQTLHGHLIYFLADHVDYTERRQGHIPVSQGSAMGAFKNIFGYHWLFGPK
ncbi:hypothetical protein N431DRAFT_442636 [Stipitochalara longipes BDJ]|nr:hypothetical protein N431DRAFT_442636 [Stipitochalara longipes BDJ]